MSTDYSHEAGSVNYKKKSTPGRQESTFPFLSQES